MRGEGRIESKERSVRRCSVGRGNRRGQHAVTAAEERAARIPGSGASFHIAPTYGVSVARACRVPGCSSHRQRVANLLGCAVICHQCCVMAGRCCRMGQCAAGVRVRSARCGIKGCRILLVDHRAGRESRYLSMPVRAGALQARRIMPDCVGSGRRGRGRSCCYSGVSRFSMWGRKGRAGGPWGFSVQAQYVRLGNLGCRARISNHNGCWGWVRVSAGKRPARGCHGRGGYSNAGHTGRCGWG